MWVKPRARRKLVRLFGTRNRRRGTGRFFFFFFSLSSLFALTCTRPWSFHVPQRFLREETWHVYDLSGEVVRDRKRVVEPRKYLKEERASNRCYFTIASVRLLSRGSLVAVGKIMVENCIVHIRGIFDSIGLNYETHEMEVLIVFEGNINLFVLIYIRKIYYFHLYSLF